MGGDVGAPPLWWPPPDFEGGGGQGAIVAAPSPPRLSRQDSGNRASRCRFSAPSVSSDDEDDENDRVVSDYDEDEEENGAGYDVFRMLSRRRSLSSHNQEELQDGDGGAPAPRRALSSSGRVAMRMQAHYLRKSSFRHAFPLERVGYQEPHSHSPSDEYGDSRLAKDILLKLQDEEPSLHKLEMHGRVRMQEVHGKVQVQLQLSGERSARDELKAKAREALDGDTVMLDMARSLLLGPSSYANGFKDDPEIARLTNVLSYMEQFIDGIRVRMTELSCQTGTPSTQGLERHLRADSERYLRKLHHEKVVKEALALIESLKARRQQEVAAEKAAADASATAEAAAASLVATRQKSARDSVAAAAAVASGSVIRRHAALSLKEGIIEANIVPQNVYDKIKTSQDANVKSIRLGLRKCFAGGFNKVSNDKQKIQQIVRSISEGAQSALSAAQSAGWGDEARTFYCYSLATQIVTRAEGDQFDANYYDQAFQFSSIAVDLCALEPHVTSMLKGLVYTSCPYAMPRVTFDSAGTDDDALRKAMGMHENEDRDKYIKRMKNILVLMAAMTQTPLGVQGPGAHPFPMKEAWEWLASLLNELGNLCTKPSTKMPHVIGPILEGFLRTAGYEMQRAYGSQFVKLLSVVEKQVLPRLQPDVPHLLGPFFDEFHRNSNWCSAPKGREQLESARKWGRT